MTSLRSPGAPTLTLLGGYWLPIRDADPRGFGHYQAHYSSRKARAGRGFKRWRRNGRRYIGNGEHIGLLTVDALATFAWRKQVYRKDDQHGIECSIFRNVGPVRSSTLVDEAVSIAWERWPNARLFTYCTATFDRTRRRLIRWGECFWHAGWRLVAIKGLRFCWEMTACIVVSCRRKATQGGFCDPCRAWAYKTLADARFRTEQPPPAPTAANTLRLHEGRES